ncbi:MAG: hypothetical protein CM1200mP2_15640 [Planctomycetaceae bacterium]|nr:MAG: hypothetical protein CM1200mP2_15640 [Planctomycetaceae bacterium]
MWKTFSPVAFSGFPVCPPRSDQCELAGEGLGGRTLTAKDFRVCVTGFDHNRPKPFAGGGFLWLGKGIQVCPRDIL